MSVLTGEQTLGYLVNLKHAKHTIHYRERLDVGGMAVTKGEGEINSQDLHNQILLHTYVTDLSLVTWC